MVSEFKGHVVKPQYDVIVRHKYQKISVRRLIVMKIGVMSIILFDNYVLGGHNRAYGRQNNMGCGGYWGRSFRHDGSRTRRRIGRTDDSSRKEQCPREETTHHRRRTMQSYERRRRHARIS